jgi:hypothetical protein
MDLIEIDRPGSGFQQRRVLPTVLLDEPGEVGHRHAEEALVLEREEELTLTGATLVDLRARVVAHEGRLAAAAHAHDGHHLARHLRKGDVATGERRRSVVEALRELLAERVRGYCQFHTTNSSGIWQYYTAKNRHNWSIRLPNPPCNCPPAHPTSAGPALSRDGLRTRTRTARAATAASLLPQHPSVRIFRTRPPPLHPADGAPGALGAHAPPSRAIPCRSCWPRLRCGQCCSSWSHRARALPRRQTPARLGER